MRPLALSLCLLATAAGAAAREGRVLQATRARAYLDKGALDGLAEGAVLELRRSGAPAGRCKIEQLFDHAATCTGAPARAGDSFALPELGAKPAVPTLRAPARSPAEKAAEERALEAATLAPIEFRGGALSPGLPGTAPRIEVELAHATWATNGAGPFNQERLDINARGVPIGKGFAVWLDMSARHWTRQGDTERFRPGTRDQLYVWEAQVSARTEESWLLSLGRINPWNAPGAPRIDGAQVGFRSERGDEIGVYGGALPDPVTLAPGFDRATAGLFWSVQRRQGKDSALPILMHEGRIALVATPEGGTRFEGEGSAQASLFKLIDLAADARAGAGGNEASGLEAVRVDLGAHPFSRLSLSGGFRYIGIALPQYSSLGAASGGPSREGDASLSYEIIQALQLSAAAGASDDLTSGLKRSWIGPDLALPTLFGQSGGLLFGYREEYGWFAGRSAWVQSTVRPFSRLRLLARFSWTADTRPDSGHDISLGLFGSAAAQLGEHLEVRLDFLTRADPYSLNRQGVPIGDGGFFKLGLAGMF